VVVVLHLQSNMIRIPRPKKEIRQNIKPDILPKSGAGQWGTKELADTYRKDTPGQSITKFKDYKTTK
jgi:hypothetical protein